MNITINSIELASKLADDELNDNWDELMQGDLYIEDEDEIRYSEEAQDIFDSLYDKYMNIIDNCKSINT
jgi:hypothetical protein